MEIKIRLYRFLISGLAILYLLTILVVIAYNIMGCEGTVSSLILAAFRYPGDPSNDQDKSGKPFRSAIKNPFQNRG
jgi:hypothetical protein